MESRVLRDDMVDSLEHESKGILTSDAVGMAMRQVPREAFVSETAAAYADRSHREYGTTVLAPSTVARLLQAAAPEPGESTLVIGAGVGYTVAVVAELVGGRHVHAVDLSQQLVQHARRNLSRAGYEDVLVVQGDGAAGLPAYGPYDCILVEAAVLEVPSSLRDQVREAGRIVVPQGGQVQELRTITDDGDRIDHGTIALNPLLVPGEESGAIERNRTRREDREFAERAATRRSGWEHSWIEWEER